MVWATLATFATSAFTTASKWKRSETGDGNAKLGIHHWADKFVGRGVLIDAFGFRKKQGRRGEPACRKMFIPSKN